MTVNNFNHVLRSVFNCGAPGLRVNDERVFYDGSPVWFEPEHPLPPTVRWQDPFPAVLRCTWSDPPTLLGWETQKKEQRIIYMRLHAGFPLSDSVKSCSVFFTATDGEQAVHTEILIVKGTVHIKIKNTYRYFSSYL